MKRTQFLTLIDDILELDHGTIKGDEVLSSLPKWDSLAILSLIAMVDTHFQVQVSIDALVACQTVSDLEGLLGGKVGG